MQSFRLWTPISKAPRPKVSPRLVSHFIHAFKPTINLTLTTSCSQSKITFTNLTILSRHNKYHSRPHKCLVPSCAELDVAFSLAKDLRRHQRTHSDERYFCPHPDCFSAVGGKFRGFSRLDNWRRHLMKQHIYGVGS